MKFIEKEFINEHDRNIKILGLKFFYSKARDDKSNKAKYSVKFADFTFNFYKRRNRLHQKGLLKIDNEKREYLLIYSKCIRNLFLKNNTIQTLVLGASTARCSYIEDDSSLNLGIDAQDLYYSYQLFNKTTPHIPNLKNLVLYYDVFSTGNNLDISPQKFVTAFYKYFFDIPYKNKLIATQNNLITLENKIFNCRKYINKHLDKVPYDIMPIVHSGLWTKKEIKELAEAELKLANKGNMNMYLNLLLEEAKNLNIYIVFAPRNPIASKVYPPTRELFKPLYDLLKQHSDKKIKIIDCFNNFEEEDFVDLVHLNMNGAKKITEIINNHIKGN